TVTLADRTVVVLDTDTALDVRFDDTARRLRLLRGTIMVTSGHDDRVPARPLVVATAQGELRPLGTRFTVRQRDGATRVEVFAGAVRVQPDDATADARVIAAGEGADFTRDTIGAPAPLDAYASAWTGGMLVASRMRLADLVAGRPTIPPRAAPPAAAPPALPGQPSVRPPSRRSTACRPSRDSVSPSPATCRVRARSRPA
ncbi:FecR domain-containing protein, partial [Burkholderia sp. Tr-849]|uniref:FecR family protein n=1 Tax=Burkholderia sp. Tr-849 TaxID=2608330 RepID=UPI001F050129